MTDEKKVEIEESTATLFEVLTARKRFLDVSDVLDLFCVILDVLKHFGTFSDSLGRFRTFS